MPVISEIPPRVEYQVTPFGRKFIRILDPIEKLQEEIEKPKLTENLYKPWTADRYAGLYSTEPRISVSRCRYLPQKSES
jgi:hypothetical protein